MASVSPVFSTHYGAEGAWAFNKWVTSCPGLVERSDRSGDSISLRLADSLAGTGSVRHISLGCQPLPLTTSQIGPMTCYIPLGGNSFSTSRGTHPRKSSR